VPTAAADIGNVLSSSMRAMPCMRAPEVPHFMTVDRAAITRFTFDIRMRTDQKPSSCFQAGDCREMVAA